MSKAEKKERAETPLMRQYNQIKEKHPDALLLFRVGDFYETFGEDAIKTSRILGIVLTKRANGAASHIELAGFPYHSLDNYLPKLVRAGLRVAICDQLEDPSTTKTIVKRGVTELVSRGVAHQDLLLQGKQNNFLCALVLMGDVWGAAFIDLSTGEFLVTEGGAEYVEKLIPNYGPSETLYPKGQETAIAALGLKPQTAHAIDDWIFKPDYAQEILTGQFEVASLRGFGVSHLPVAIVAAGACLHYIKESHPVHLKHLTHIARIDEEKYVWLDKFTLRNLEVIHANHEEAHSLLSVVDATVSPMGSRLLRKWMVHPLKDMGMIESRLQKVDWFFNQEHPRLQLIHLLEKVGDVERMIAKISLQRANPRELLQFCASLEPVEKIKHVLLTESEGYPDHALLEALDPLVPLRQSLTRFLNPDAPALLQKGNVVAKGINHELDDLREMLHSGKQYLVEIQKREIKNTGISSLKISFNSVFGYYFEITHAHKDKIPSDWIRKQTLVNAERYITPELKTYEDNILGAEEKIAILEAVLYQDLLKSLAEYVSRVQQNAAILAQLDVLSSFASLAVASRYVRPKVHEGGAIRIEGGRHPVIEKYLPVGEQYVPNDLFLDGVTQQVIMITGPNMSGKSALLRQTALIVLLAQIGSFVPAALAEISVVDRLYTRIGSSDNLSAGQSTFMVEMNETASILNNLSNNSLVLLDEIGRGTSTFDGISLAWSIAEFIHDHPKCRAKTLFATHYHELNDMATLFPRIKNYHFAIKKIDNRIVFLRKLKEGGSEHSFGIHVAKMAGLPSKVLSRAKEMLTRLEKGHGNMKDPYQLSFFEQEGALLLQVKEKINALEINLLTPLEGLNALSELQTLFQNSTE